MEAKDITALGEALSTFRNDVIKCDALKCNDCMLYTSSPTMVCAYSVMQRAILSAELEVEIKNSMMNLKQKMQRAILSAELEAENNEEKANL